MNDQRLNDVMNEMYSRGHETAAETLPRRWHYYGEQQRDHIWRAWIRG